VVGEAFEADDCDARCCELDRERQTVEPAADFDDQRGVRIGERELFEACGHALDEELHGGEGYRLGGSQVR